MPLSYASSLKPPSPDIFCWEGEEAGWSASTFGARDRPWRLRRAHTYDDAAALRPDVWLLGKLAFESTIHRAVRDDALVVDYAVPHLVPRPCAERRADPPSRSSGGSRAQRT